MLFKFLKSKQRRKRILLLLMSEKIVFNVKTKQTKTPKIFEIKRVTIS